VTFYGFMCLITVNQLSPYHLKTERTFQGVFSRQMDDTEFRHDLLENIVFKEIVVVIVDWS